MTWPQVGLVLGLTTLLVSAVVVLALNDKSVETVLIIAFVVVMPVLSAFGVQLSNKLDQVKETSNGRLTEAMKMAKESQAQVAELAMRISQNQGPSPN